MSALDKSQEIDAFKSRLVNDVFGKDNKGKVPMEKVMMLIWQFRDDPTVVQFMAQFVAKYAGARDVFDGIEFYLPQLAHMIIHLEADWDDAILERFALVIAQRSLHFALQLNWILQGAIEDYQPEMPDGEPNEQYNDLFYSRCVKLLSNIELCVVYGSPRSQKFQHLYEKGKISKEEYEMLEQGDKSFNAAQIAKEGYYEPGAEERISHSGTLLYKRHKRTSRFACKPWKTRHFAISERMLYCYNRKEGGKLNRAMPLEGASVSHVINGKYSYMFQVKNLNFHFIMRANSVLDRDEWTKILQEESEVTTTVLYPNNTGDKEDNQDQQFIQDFTPSQKARYDFFQNEREFVRDICNVAEDLRFKDRLERKILAPSLVKDLQVPVCAYVPMCNSTDIWRRVHHCIPKDTRVFNTKERCPVIMYFQTTRGEDMNHQIMSDVNLDVAHYLHLQYQVADEQQQLKQQQQPNMSVIEEQEETIDELGIAMDADTVDPPDEVASGTRLWREYGTSVVKSPHPNNAEHSGNSQLQSFLKNNMTRLPAKFSGMIRSRRSFSSSLLDTGTLPMFDTVPIVDSQIADDADDSSVVSDVSSSILTSEGILHVGEERDGISKDCMDRAKQVVCGGESYADMTERMLRITEEEDQTQNNNLLEDDVKVEIYGVMAKSNDDLRQEVFVMQMIHFYKSVFAKADLPIWLKTYRILSTSKDCGLIEVLTDATSIDGLKKADNFPKVGGLRAYFEETYGPPDCNTFLAAQRNFMISLVGYSIVSYLLGLKDRHNGNIMIDLRGHVIFIDFGFAMGMAPGHEFSMERAAFKLTQDYVDVLGGLNSDCFSEFKRMFVEGFEAARANSQIALGLVEIMMHKSNYPCFSGHRYGGHKAIKGFEQRLMLYTPDDEVADKAERLVDNAANHWGTRYYDKFQKWTNGYAI